MKTQTRTVWTFVITSVALFMVVLDNLVVSTALPVIRTDLGATIEELEWTVNAYTLTFAVFLLTGAALGDRFGRRRMFIVGLTIFTLASAAAALAPSMEALIAARAVQGIGGAIVTPLTLTILSGAFPAERRGVALGAWSGIAGLAVAAGPLVGGAVVDGIAWQWIFWLNVPIGIAVLPLARLLTESHGPDKALDLPGLGLVSGGLFGLVWGLDTRQRRRLGQPADRRLARSWCRAPRRLRGLGGAGSWSRCCRFASSRTGPSPRPTVRHSRCTSACSGRSSCSRSSSRPRRATRRSRQGCGCCRGRRCR